MSSVFTFRRRKFDAVVVWALDRLTRSLKQLLTIGEECRSLGDDTTYLLDEQNKVRQYQGKQVKIVVDWT